MTTEAQLAANRQNALLSTGPTTDAGKAASSLNALTHGLRASTPILPSEDPLAYQAFLQSLHDDLTPIGPLQAQLVARIATILWKMQRIAPAEAQALLPKIEEKHRVARSQNSYLPKKKRLAEVPLPAPEEIIAGEFTWQTNPLTRLQDYEVRLECSLMRTLRHLRDLQKFTHNRDKNEKCANEPNSAITPCQT